MLSADDLNQIRQKLRREPTDVEIAAFENLWSEHCSYRSTRRLLKTLPTTGKNVLLGPGDDAAIVRFTDHHALAVGMESHNHPSYIDPYNGAATGVGGIVRDVLSMGARPIALMDPLYFGPLDKEKNRYLLENVVAGIGGYGNCIGVPVVRGDLAFDSSYDGNPLVNVVCIGIVDPSRFITGRAKQPGNHLLLIGATTGRDGLGGASFASRDLAEDSGAQERSNVQIGDPFTEQLLIEAILEMAGTGKVCSCRDLGAAGLAGASSEMCSTFGGLIHADRVHLREPNMRPVEIMLAESQERMMIEVAPGDVPLMGEIAEKYDLMWSDVGEVIAEPRYIVRFHGRTVCDLPIDFLCGDAPECTWPQCPYDAVRPFVPPKAPLRDLFLSVLSHPEVASRAWVSGQYDHDVQLRTVAVAGDAALLRLDDEGLALSCGCNPRHIFLSPSDGTANAVYENAANLACVGAEPLCIVNCLNFASPVHPEISWQIAECVRGMGDMARAMGIPIVGGNVSLYNESDELGTQIKPTPSIGMVGRARPRPRTVPHEGMLLALAGTAGEHFGGSVLDVLTGCCGSPPPRADPGLAVQIRALVNARSDLAVTDLSQGGLAAALATFCPGARVEIGGLPLQELFSETYGRFLIAYHDEKDLLGIPFRKIGEVTPGGFDISGAGCRIMIDRDEIELACSSLTRIMRG
ncbi:MAG TPA: phosphoribosylformylglycinamidine synthase subunit PurL [Methanoregulaceae archaeon]|nr:MAG: phosphoribosylformylglycinamidine synthase subunit PurL [Methanolinea sp.]HON81561.1 phosphoribosylformylglycinamidine synthase subunit PurL [Methanoregulaceae archaeon]HPD10368.1 phosphoribosylformylglycinamidine synthase subunit PurL [Methanoregulaceae archaeon]HRT15310.1 phosphoribosylformylglycinamidine synthase subunit PurL [Methanoregulaceae archaeon]HRU30960.1 phosphoribosylformylglycinamidine synthase subunit PurL [Methanoregulaceae archaeon]